MSSSTTFCYASCGPTIYKRNNRFLIRSDDGNSKINGMFCLALSTCSFCKVLFPTSVAHASQKEADEIEGSKDREAFFDEREFISFHLDLTCCNGCKETKKKEEKRRESRELVKKELYKLNAPLAAALTFLLDDKKD